MNPGWDDLLFRGAARYYQQGRLPYAEQLVATLRTELGLDGTGTLADFGAGPGTLAIPMAAEFAKVFAVEPDAEMVAAGRTAAHAAGVTNIEWHIKPAEELMLAPDSLDVAVFGQSFHWMDRDRIAARLRTALRPGGHFMVISDLKRPLAPVPGAGVVPQQQIDVLITEYLGAGRRAGRRTLPNGTPGNEEKVLAAAGYLPPKQLVVPAPDTMSRTVDDLVADVYSRSNSAPHLFGERLSEFDARLRAVLDAEAVNGGYVIARPPTEVRIWTNP